MTKPTVAGAEREQLRQECRTAYRELRAQSPSSKPTQDEFCKASGIPRSKLRKAYGTRAYAKLQEECGDDPNVWSTDSVPLDRIMEQYGSLVRSLKTDDGLPTSTHWVYENCEPTFGHLTRRFKWNEMPSAFLGWAADKSEWNDAVAVVSARMQDSQPDDDASRLDPDFESVIQLVEKWIPDRKRRSEEGYQVALRSFLEQKRYRVEEGAGDSDVDLAVNDKVGIELKKDPVLAEYDRCFGQIARHLNNYDYVLVVVLNATHQDRFREFESNVDKFYIAIGLNVVVIRK